VHALPPQRPTIPLHVLVFRDFPSAPPPIRGERSIWCFLVFSVCVVLVFGVCVVLSVCDVHYRGKKKRERKDELKHVIASKNLRICTRSPQCSVYVWSLVCAVPIAEKRGVGWVDTLTHMLIHTCTHIHSLSHTCSHSHTCAHVHTLSHTHTPETIA